MAHSHTARPITDANNVKIIPSERTYIRLWRIDGAISPIYTRTTGSDFTPSRPACVAGDSIDYSVFCGEWCIGRIYEKRSAAPASAGSGRCSAPANPTAFATRTKWRRWTRPRLSLRQVGSNGRRGQSWRKLRRNRDYAKFNGSYVGFPTDTMPRVVLGTPLPARCPHLPQMLAPTPQRVAPRAGSFFPDATTMPLYRVYTLSKSDHIERPPSIITCANDQEAVEGAKSLMDGNDIELWDGVRFVTRVKAESTDPRRKSLRGDQSRRT